jgi:hypothetical protein
MLIELPWPSICETNDMINEFMLLVDLRNILKLLKTDIVGDALAQFPVVSTSMAR